MATDPRILKFPEIKPGKRVMVLGSTEVERAGDFSSPLDYPGNPEAVTAIDRYQRSHRISGVPLIVLATQCPFVLAIPIDKALKIARGESGATKFIVADLPQESGTVWIIDTREMELIAVQEDYTRSFLDVRGTLVDAFKPEARR